MTACRSVTPQPEDPVGPRDAAEDPRFPDPNAIEDVVPWAFTGFPEWEDYHDLVRRVLLPEHEPEIWLVARVSLADEYAVALDDSYVPKYPDEEVPAGAWSLTVASGSIWRSQDTSADGPAWNKLTRNDFDVARRTVPIDRAAAAEIAEAWQSVVRRARHPKPVFDFDEEGRRYELRWSGNDGIDYEFRNGRRYAQSWSPEKGPATDLITLIDILATAADVGDPAQRDAIVGHCAVAARALRERVEARPW